MRTAEDDRAYALEQVILLGDAATIRAAHILNEQLWNLERPARGTEEITESDWRERANRWLVALNDFHACARQGLGVSEEFARRDVVAFEDSKRA